MKKLFALSLTTGILCGIWIILGIALKIPTWIGFAGCTAFFAAGGNKNNGVKKALFSTLSGVFWASIIIQLGRFFPSEQGAALITGIITFIMCIQGGIKLFTFIPGTFIGSFSTFAANGEIQLIILGLMLGIFLGFLCDLTGEKLGFILEKESIKN